MPDEQLKMILRVFAAQVGDGETGVDAVTHALIDATVKFRDKLKSDAGITLTVEDARKALNGLETALNGEPIPTELSSEQKALAQIYVDRMTLFKQA